MVLLQLNRINEQNEKHLKDSVLILTYQMNIEFKINAQSFFIQQALYGCS